MFKENDLISRSALIEQLERLAVHEDPFRQSCILGIVHTIAKAPSVDAVVLPEGKPGDYVEWNTGAGYTNIYRIISIIIGEDFIRYDLGRLAPIVDHKNIVRIMSKEEAAKEMVRRCDYGK